MIDRRDFLKASAALGAAGSLLGVACTRAVGSTRATRADPDGRWVGATIADLQAAMASGEATALSITQDHLARIEGMDWDGPKVNSIIEVNPDAEAIAAALDAERAAGSVRGPLHGVPIVLKDVLATADRMETTAGSLALVRSKVPRDAGAVTRLREAGAIILGKANLSEWQAFRGWPTRGGWSGRAGVVRNPYALNFSTGDSSSGSAAAVAASFAAASIGVETYGSIVMPSSLCGVVGLRPTIGLISRSGTIPISFSRDTVGPMARTVRDLAAVLTGIVGEDTLDPLTAMAGRREPDFLGAIEHASLRGARIGVWRRHDLWETKNAEPAAKVIGSVLRVFEEEGATLVDPVDLPHWIEATGHHVGVMSTELRHSVDRYLAGLLESQVRTLDDVVAFNKAHADTELEWHPQNLLEDADRRPLNDPAYLRDLRLSRRIARGDFEREFRRHRLDAIVAPTFVRSWPINLLDGDPYMGNGVAGISNAAGYPNLTVPAGFADELPIGISFLGRAWDEPKLLKLGAAFERAVSARREPRFLDAGADFVSR